MGTKYFSEEELKDYSDQGLIDKEIKIRSNEFGSICVATLSAPDDRYYVIKYIVDHNTGERVFFSGEYNEFLPHLRPCPDAKFVSHEMIDAFTERLKIQK